MPEAAQIQTRVQTETTIKSPDVPPGTGYLGLVVAAVVALLALRRGFSKTKLSNANDHSQQSMLETAIKERDRAMASAEKAWASRTKDAVQIGKLTADVKHLTAANTAMRDEVEHLTATNKDMRNEVEMMRNEMALFRQAIMQMLPPGVATKLAETSSASALARAVQETTNVRKAAYE